MKIAVLGAGSWGTALAVHGARCGHSVALWSRDPAVVAGIRGRRRHPRRFHEIEIPDTVSPTSDPAGTSGSDLAILAVPSGAAGAILEMFGTTLGGAPLLSAVKGFDPGTNRTVSRLAAVSAPSSEFAVLSGPTFAAGLLARDPTAAVIASKSETTARWIQEALSNAALRLYTTSDVTGVELAGGLKNVIAIAAGIVAGLGYGPNTLAALATRGLAEIARLVTARGGEPDTLLGLAGVGDLMLTCTGTQSRNRRLGERIGSGQPAADAMAGMGEVAEGARNCLAACALAAESGIEMPISEAVRDVLYGGLDPAAAIGALMVRELRRE
jgi:glycerol-3-phosphate dehydrogenase (NAD(P)+)